MAVAAGLAACGILVVGLLSRDNGPRSVRVPVPPPVAALLVRAGDVTVTGPGTHLQAGSAVATGKSGRAALRLVGGASLRVDVSSRIRLESATLVALEQGAIYVDSDPRLPSVPVAIDTPLATVRHVGTQFEVRLLEDASARAPSSLALRVTVREGVVEVGHGSRGHEARAGAELTLRADGSIERDTAAVQGPTWEWTQHAAPAFEIEGETLATFLDWVSRETGLRWRYAEPGLQRIARETILHGSVAGLTPEEALSVVLAGSGMRHRRSEQALLLEPVSER